MKDSFGWRWYLIWALPYESEEDIWFVYCACAIKNILEEKFHEANCSLNTQEIEDYIISCQAYDQGFSWIPSGESHSGLSYCALASLKLLKSSFIIHDSYIQTIMSK